MLGDVSNPQSARAVGGELAPDQVGDRLLDRHLLGPAAQRQPAEPGPSHERYHCVVALTFINLGIMHRFALLPWMDVNGLPPAGGQVWAAAGPGFCLSLVTSPR